MKELLSFIALCLLLVLFGWVSHYVYLSYSNDRLLDGIMLKDIKDHKIALETASYYDNGGDWVCVNVKGMEYERAVETCQHEASHEIFAEIIEKEPDKINKVMEAIK